MMGVENPRPFRIAHLTDTHVREGDAYEGFVGALQAASSAGAEAIVLGGDTVMNSVNSDRPRVEAQWAEYRRAVDGFTDLTVFPCMGNQDVWGWNQKMSGCKGDEPLFGKAMFLHQMGIPAPFYAAQLGAWRLIVLDSIQRGGRHGFYASLDPVQRGWLEAELQADTAVPTVVATHVPIVPGPAEFFALNQLAPDQSGNWSLPDHVVHRDSHDLVSLFARFPNVRLCLSGHTHLTQGITLWGTTYVVSPPVAGAWWRGDFLGQPRGFSLVDLHPEGTFQIETVRL
jgi:3',5'-cyclic AMP phosphodiesterase CpdA